MIMMQNMPRLFLVTSAAATSVPAAAATIAPGAILYPNIERMSCAFSSMRRRAGSPHSRHCRGLFATPFDNERTTTGSSVMEMIRTHSRAKIAYADMNGKRYRSHSTPFTRLSTSLSNSISAQNQPTAGSTANAPLYLIHWRCARICFDLCCVPYILN